MKMFDPPNEEEEEATAQAQAAAAAMIDSLGATQTGSTYTLPRNSKRSCKLNRWSLKKKRGMLNYISISLVIILYLYLPNVSRISSLSHYYYSNKIINKINVANRSIDQRNALLSRERSLFGLVAASPAPEPSPSARAKTSGSGSQRLPPMNGSIFGKRSLVDKSKSKSNESSKRERISSSGEALDQREESNKSGEKLIKQNDQQQYKQQQFQRLKMPKAITASSSGERGGDIGNYADYKSLQSVPIPMLKTSAYDNAVKSHALNYKDVITEIIENFLASNNESDPEETSVAFCRMIVYECTEMLSTRSRAVASIGRGQLPRTRIVSRE